MTIAQLHKLAYTRVPKTQVHDVLHDAAVQLFGAESLKDLDGTQRDRLGQHIRSMRVTTQQPRQRSGRKGTSILMITPRQVDLINTIASEIAWTKSTLLRWLSRTFADGQQVDDVRDIGTSPMAAEVIKRLKIIKADKRQRRQTAARRDDKVV